MELTLSEEQQDFVAVARDFLERAAAPRGAEWAAGHRLGCRSAANVRGAQWVQKRLRDARVMTLYKGTSQIQNLLIGRAETGLNAFV